MKISDIKSLSSDDTGIISCIVPESTISPAIPDKKQYSSLVVALQALSGTDTQ